MGTFLSMYIYGDFRKHSNFLGHTLSETTPLESPKDMYELSLESFQLIESFKYEVREFHPNFLKNCLKVPKKFPMGNFECACEMCKYLL